VVGQVKIVGILMIVHGATVVIMGGLLAFLGSFIAFGMPAGPPPGGGGAAAGGGPPPAGVQAMVSAIYIGWGAVIAVVGILNGIAGFRIMYLRGRVLALVALFANIVAVMTCYCGPTGVGMMVYGLIVLFQSDVARAFEAVGRGENPEDVIARFSRRPGYGDDFDDRPRYGEERRTRRDDEDDRRPRDEDDRRPRDQDRE
jgi:hypothetical protein